MSIRTTTIDGVMTTTIDEDGWLYTKAGYAPWTATHERSGTVIDTRKDEIAAARQVAADAEADLPAEPATETAQPAFTFTVATRFSRRFGAHRSGEPTRG